MYFTWLIFNHITNLWTTGLLYYFYIRSDGAQSKWPRAGASSGKKLDLKERWITTSWSHWLDMLLQIQLRNITTNLFVIYLTMLLVAPTINRRIIVWLLTMNWKGCGRKRSWPNLRYVTDIWLEAPRKIQQTSGQLISESRFQHKTSRLTAACSKWLYL
jgi:hypothetical protein